MEMRERILELAKAEGLRVGDDVRLDQCWVDSKVHCPYGMPEGSFINRPRAFCGTSCLHYRNHIPQDEVNEMNLESFRECFEDNHTTVASELRALADDCTKGSTEEHFLLGAAEVVEAKKVFNRDILLRDDLP